jgi:hypothetical protein
LRLVAVFWVSGRSLRPGNQGLTKQGWQFNLAII